MSEFDDKTPVDLEAVEVLDLSELIDAHIDAQSQNDFENEIPTVIELTPVCPGCGHGQFRMEATDQPPASHAQAWRAGPLVNGKPLYEEGACRGNRIWFWCKASVEHGYVGTLIIINRPGEGGMIVLFFKDRRIAPRPVAVERRGLPPGAPKKGVV